jgi:hypothetical protein
VDLTISSDDAEESKPAPDIFEIVLRKLEIEGIDGVASGFRPNGSTSKLFNLRWPIQARLGRAICVADVSSGD